MMSSQLLRRHSNVTMISLMPASALLCAPPRFSRSYIGPYPPVICAVSLLSTHRRYLATITDVKDTHNLIEKIVQRYALDLPEGYTVKSGDYVTIQPEHVMTPDNTGAV